MSNAARGVDRVLAEIELIGGADEIAAAKRLQIAAWALRHEIDEPSGKGWDAARQEVNAALEEFRQAARRAVRLAD